MSETLVRVQTLVAQEATNVSSHAYDELIKDDILADEVMIGVVDAFVIEDYPTAVKGPSVLVLQKDFEGRPIHVLWGIPIGLQGPAVIISAYRPDPARWSADFTRRKKP